MLVALQPHPGLPAGKFEGRGGAAVGGISKVGVDLEHRAGVDEDRMTGFVALGVVGVGGMRHIA